MRSMCTLAAVAMILAYGQSFGADPQEVGALILVPIKDGKKEVEAKVGDLLQFDLSYAVVPDQLVSDLKLELSGKGLTHVATVHVAKRSPEGKPVIGVMSIAGFIRADAPGDVTVKILPRLSNGKNGMKAEFNVKVGEK